MAVFVAFSIILCKNRYILAYKNENHILEQEIVKNVHVHKSSNWIVLKHPTCTEDGISVKICRECKRKYREKHLEKTGHIGTWGTIVEPTCTSKGIKRLVCEKCHEILDMEERPCLGHKYMDCVCIRCGYMTLQDKVHHQMFFTKYTAKTTGIKSSGNVVIPSVITYAGEKYEIIGIGYALCYGNKTITSITLPDTIKYIEGYAFDHCENMVSCNLPDGLISIGSAAFQCCSRLKHVELPNSLQQIGNFAFNHCSSVDNTCIRIPDSIELLGKFPEAPAHMFYDCGTDAFKEFQIEENQNGYMVQDGILYARNGKTLIAIPGGKDFENGVFEVLDTVENLGELSFSRNKNIHTVVISDKMLITGEATEKEQQSYNNIGNQLSISCYVYTDVTNYQVKDSNPNYISKDGVLYTRDLATVVAIPNKYEGILDIPESTTAWQKEALWTDIDNFKNLEFNRITEIRIPAAMETIDEGQVIAMNKLADYYGTRIFVADGNQNYKVDESGHLVKIETEEEIFIKFVKDQMS